MRTFRQIILEKSCNMHITKYKKNMHNFIKKLKIVNIIALTLESIKDSLG